MPTELKTTSNSQRHENMLSTDAVSIVEASDVGQHVI